MIFGEKVFRALGELRAAEVDDETDISHHGIKGMKWGKRNGPPYPLNSKQSVSQESYQKLNDIYKSMSSSDRRLIDPDSNDGEGYFPDYHTYTRQTAYNGLTDNGFIVAEKIPSNKNVDGTHGVEIGVGAISKGQGTGTRLVEDMKDWFNNQDEFDTMWWPVDKNNAASTALAKKCGFIKDPYGDNYIYANGEAYRKLGICDKHPDDIYNKLDTFDYGCIIDGKRYNETNLDEVDWSKYRTTPVKEFVKTKIGTCWDYTNYQHAELSKAGIKHETHMLVMDTNDGPITHTFTTFEDPINHRQYWLEQALYSERGIHPIGSYKDAVSVISKKYDASGKREFDVYRFNPDGMDSGLTDQEFFNKATADDPIMQNKLSHSSVFGERVILTDIYIG